MNACRRCKAPIIWAETERGKKMPLDAEPVDLATLTHSRGLFVLRDWPGGEEGRRVAVAVTDGFVLGSKDPAYVSHFATCPYAEEFRK